LITFNSKIPNHHHNNSHCKLVEGKSYQKGRVTEGSTAWTDNSKILVILICCAKNPLPYFTNRMFKVDIEKVKDKPHEYDHFLGKQH
jgi:hypothetical protein